MAFQNIQIKTFIDRGGRKKAAALRYCILRGGESRNIPKIKLMNQAGSPRSEI
jgi:hypothetical protein